MDSVSSIVTTFLHTMETSKYGHHEKVLEGLNAQRECSELTDVVLEVGERSFPCHRAVLACSSPYFRTMFTSGYAEAEQGRIRIHDVSEVAMATILNYTYTGRLKLEPNQVQAVMSAARLVQVDFVFSKAAEYMKELLDISNCADVLMYSDMLGDVTLQKASRRYMASRFDQVALQPSFLQLSLPQLQSLLNRDDLLTDSEDIVVQAALRWIAFDQKERLQHLPALCKSFRHSFISSKHLVELESKCLSAECKLVYSNNRNHRLRQKRTEMQIFLREDPWDLDFMFSVPCYDSSKGMSYSMRLPHGRRDFSVAVTSDDELYLAGHIFGKMHGIEINTKKAFLQYNHLLNSWESRCEMTSPRTRCGLVYLKGYIYAIGSDDGRSPTAERYDPSCDEWTSINSIPSLEYSLLCAVTLGDNIYVIGKEGCYCFSPTENSWRQIADMLASPESPQAVMYQGCIFCVSRGDRTYVEMYNPRTGVWKRSGNDMSFPCDDATMMLCRELLFLITIQNDSNIALYQYHPETDCWLKTKSHKSKVPPIRWWIGARRRTKCRTDCLVARMLPSCLGQQEEEEVSDDTSLDLLGSDTSDGIDGHDEDDLSDTSYEDESDEEDSESGDDGDI